MKKMLFALLAGMFGMMMSSCDKDGVELAGILEVTVQTLPGNDKLVDYPVILTKSLETTPYVELKRGVTDKNGVCRFEFKSGELTDYNVVDGNYVEGYAVALDPATQKPAGYTMFTLQQGNTLLKTVFVRLNQ